MKLNLPTNSSISVTLSQADLRTHTTASCSAAFSAPDTLLLNGEPQDIQHNARTQACLRQLRAWRAALEEEEEEEAEATAAAAAAEPAEPAVEADTSQHPPRRPRLPPLSTYPLRIASTNNFPTAAGLASSAAGFAALVRAVADLYALPHTPTQLSRVARQGSGSACRSLFGGFVEWHAGGGFGGGDDDDDGVAEAKPKPKPKPKAAGETEVKEGDEEKEKETEKETEEKEKEDDGADSVAEQLAPAAHWPDVRALVLVVSAARKSVASTAGMQATVATSALFATRAAAVVPARVRRMRAAVRARDFAAFARVAMQDSNGFHATCLDTFPPIFYLNDVSRAAIALTDAVNGIGHQHKHVDYKNVNYNKNVKYNGGASGAGGGGGGGGGGDGSGAVPEDELDAAYRHLVAAYTFDAGPNAVIYYLAKDEARVVGAFRSVLGHVPGWKASSAAASVVGAPSTAQGDNSSSSSSSKQLALLLSQQGVAVDEKTVQTLRDGVASVICTGVGEGPAPTDEHLIDEAGNPVAAALVAQDT